MMDFKWLANIYFKIFQSQSSWPSSGLEVSSAVEIHHRLKSLESIKLTKYSVASHLVVCLRNYHWRNLLLDEKGEVKDIGDRYLACPGVHHLHQSNILIAKSTSSPPLLRLWSEYSCPRCTWCESRSRAGIRSPLELWTKYPPCGDRKVFPCWRIEDSLTGGPWCASPEHIGVSPGQLQSLSHDEPSEHLIVQISVLGLTNLNVLHPRILGEDPFTNT